MRRLGQVTAIRPRASEAGAPVSRRLCPRRLLLAGAVLVASFTASSAQAFYPDGASIVSAHFGRLEQADDTTQYAAISGDGRYVVIQTRARNLFADDDPDPPGRTRLGGLFRFDIATRTIELVADGSEAPENDTNTVLVRGALNPSVSHDGRHVAFSTGQQLVPQDMNGNVDVYVRDMTIPIRAPGAFDLVSAKDSGDVPATYGPRIPDQPGVNPGAEVTRGAAISADGTRVLFRTIEVSSDLPAQLTQDTPGFQVFLRDRVANTTTLVTRRASDGSPAGGALGPAGMSADGTTAVWTGRNAADQTRFIDGENTDPAFLHYLWRRVADGAGAATRRITGVSDPDDPACPPDASVFFDQTSTGPCYGPLTEPEYLRAGITNLLPAISADGRRVAFLTGSGPRPNANTAQGLDLYLTDMSPGQARKGSTVELTREGIAGDLATGASIDSVSMSADGRRLALTTSRTRFLLPALTYQGSARLAPTARELYVVDLPTRTIERVTRSFTGGDTNGDVVNDPSLSADGERVAFVSFAGNLFFGDGYPHADAFWTERRPEPPPDPGGGAGAGGDPGGGVTVVEDPDAPFLGVRVLRSRRGRLVLRVRVPAAGTVAAAARARVGRPRRQRVLARETRFHPRSGALTIRLRVVRRYRRELARRSRIPARLRVTFSPSRGGRRLSRSPRASFRK
jgi:WD40-like Beta Propeller Repeat